MESTTSPTPPPTPCPSRAASIGIVGGGAIGSLLRDELAGDGVAQCRLGGIIASRREGLDALDHLAETCDILIEAAGVEAVAGCLAAASRYGRPIVVCSTAAFADHELEARLAADPGRVILPAGAIGGLDLGAAVARSGATMAVTLTTTKTPGALGADPGAGRHLTFTGSARQAALRFPKTSNVAVTLALATVGLDAMAVEVVADPEARRTHHVVTIDSDLGTYRFDIDNALAPGSGGRTSSLTAWSALVAAEQAAARLAAPIETLPINPQEDQ